MIARTYLLAAAVLAALTTTLTAQVSSVPAVMDALPQQVYANPALQPNARLLISIPLLGQVTAAHQNNFFKPADQFDGTSPGTFTLDAEALIRSIDDYARLSLSAEVELFHIGFKAGQHYLHLSANEHMDFELKLARDLLALTYYGNANSEAFEGNTAYLGGTSLNAQHYRSYNLGYSIQATEQWSAGLTLQYLYGMERIHTRSSSLQLHTEPNSMELTSTGALQIETAGIYGFATDSAAVQANASPYMWGLNNQGWALDLGVAWTGIPRWQIDAAITDIGRINWRSDIANYGTTDASFAYSGLDFSEFITSDGQGSYEDHFRRELDTLLTDLEETYGFNRSTRPFATPLHTYARLGAQFKLAQFACGDASLFAAYRQPLGAGLPIWASLGYSQHLWKHLQVTVHGSYLQYSPLSLGAALMARAGPVQLFVSADNIQFAQIDRFTLLDPDDGGTTARLSYFHNPQRIGLRVGVSLAFMRDETSPAGPPMKR